MFQVIYIVTGSGGITWPLFFGLILHCCDDKHISFISVRQDVRNEKETKNYRIKKCARKSEKLSSHIYKIDYLK